MQGTGLYERPVRCRFCDRIFDFPTLTENLNERGVPVRTRICGACLAEMRDNEELHRSRMHPRESTRRSTTSLSDESNSSNISHNRTPSTSQIDGQLPAGPNIKSESTESPEQQFVHLQGDKPNAKSQSPRSSPGSRSSTDLNNILN